MLEILIGIFAESLTFQFCFDQLLFAFAVLIQCIMSMPQTFEDPAAGLEMVDDTAEDVVAPLIAIEGDQLVAEQSK